jgi:hypothetical protein
MKSTLAAAALIIAALGFGSATHHQPAAGQHQASASVAQDLGWGGGSVALADLGWGGGSVAPADLGWGSGSTPLSA